MSVRIFTGEEAGGSEGAVLYDSTTGWAFGPIFADVEQAVQFLEFAEKRGIFDVRKVVNFVALVEEFFAEVREAVEA